MTLKGVERKKKQCIGIRFFPKEFYCFFLLVQSQQNDDLFKVIKMTILIVTYDLFKFSKMTTMFFDLFKVSKMTNHYDLLKVSCA